MKPCANAPDVDEREVLCPDTGTGRCSVVHENDAILDLEAFKRNPIIDREVFRQLHHTDEFKNLLNFLDNIVIDPDGNNFNFVNPELDELEEHKEDTTVFETDGIFTRRRSYSNQYSPIISQSADNLDLDSEYEEPKSTASFKSTELKLLPCDIPPTDPKVLQLIERDSDKMITVGGKQQVLRFYDQTAITFIDMNDPREVTYEGGSVEVVIDDTYLIKCSFNKPDIVFVLNNQLHKIHLGPPTRELYIDDNFYSCSFNGPAIQCVFNNITRSVKIIGDPPSVVIGDTKRLDLVAAISHVIIDDLHPEVVYLDAKPQCIDVGQSKLVLCFVDKLMSVLINNQYFKVNYDGEPLDINVEGNLHFLKFKKPPYFQPGLRAISGMLNIVPTEKYTCNSTYVPSYFSTTNTNNLKSLTDVEECFESVEKHDLSSNFSDSKDGLTALEFLQSYIYKQLNKSDSNQTTSIVPSPTIDTVIPNSVNSIDKFPNEIENDEHQLDYDSLYYNTELKIRYFDGFHIQKRKKSTSEPEILKEQLKAVKKTLSSKERRKKRKNHQKKSLLKHLRPE